MNLFERSHDIVYRRDSTILLHKSMEALAPSMTNALLAYLAVGHPLGGFLTSVVTGDFFRASINADHINFGHLGHFGRWIYQTWPEAAYGSLEKMQAWEGFEPGNYND